MVNGVVWDEDLAAYASAWANDLAARAAFEHRPDTPYGENIAMLMAASGTAAVKFATDLWYDEVENYDFAAPGFSADTGHFTQLCWADTVRIGAGVGRSGDFLYVVMNFDPPGNYLGSFEANVFPKAQLAPATPLSPPPPSPVATPPPSPSPPVATPPVIDPTEIVNHVNAYRRDHMVNGVVWDEDLAAYASAWANDIAARTAYEYRPDTPYGENIALLEAVNGTAAVKLATDIWYVEVENYDFTAPGFSADTIRFTQLCWADTVRIGAGVGRNGDLMYVVMNFDPPGNYIGSFRANVFPKAQLAPIRAPINETLGASRLIPTKLMVTMCMVMCGVLMLRFALL